MIGVVQIVYLRLHCSGFLSLFFPFSPPPLPTSPMSAFGWIGWGEGVGDGGVFHKLGYHVFCCILLLD